MKYNRALDFMVLSMNAMNKGKATLAAKLFAKATVQSDVEDAIRILEASNAKAHDTEKAAKLAAATAVKAKAQQGAAKRLAASFDDEEVVDGDDDVDEAELGADLVDDDIQGDEAVDESDPEEALAGDLAELEDGADDCEGEDTAAEFAAVLASMKKRAGRK